MGHTLSTVQLWAQPALKNLMCLQDTATHAMEAICYEAFSTNAKNAEFSRNR